MNKKAVAFVFVGAIALGFLKGGDAMAAYYGSDLSVDIEIEPSMTVTVPLTASTSITPSSAGAANTASATLQVGTNSPGGYTASLTTVGSNSLQGNKINTNTTTYSFPTIPSVAYKSGGYGTTAAAFKSASGTAGKWALKVGSGAFQNVPEPGTFTTVKTNNAMVASDSTTVTFVANLDMTVSPGTYSGEVAFVVVPNLSGFTDLDSAFMAAGKTRYYVNNTTSGYRMQDMSSAICNAVTTPTAASGSDDVPRTILIDSRDNKPYWVAKLADGKCWMTQNLGLDLGDNKTFTHDDTDLGYVSGTATSWTSTTAQLPSAAINPSTNKLSGWKINTGTDGNVNMASAYFRPGNYYYTDAYAYSSSDCSGNNCNGYISGGSFNDKFASVPYNQNGLHGSVGYYYNRAAVRATNTMTDASDAGTSICAANWRLPTWAEWDGINNQYSITSNYIRMDMAPLYFVRGGAIDSDGSILWVGNRGVYAMYQNWIFGYTHNSRNSGEFSVGNWGVPPNTGMSVRCVAR